MKDSRDANGATLKGGDFKGFYLSSSLTWKRPKTNQILVSRNASVEKYLVRERDPKPVNLYARKKACQRSRKEHIA